MLKKKEYIMSNLRLFIRLFMKSLTILIVIIFSACTSTTIPTSRPTQNAEILSIAYRNYEILQQAIQIYEEAVLHPWATIPSYAKLKAGSKNINVLALRGRLKATGELTPEDDNGLTLYDDKVTVAVKRFQLSHGLEPTGSVGPRTLVELNVSPVDRLKQIEINISRWSKLNQKMGARYIMVNVPDYRLQVVENGIVVLSMKAIVGKPERPTPELSSTVTRLVF